MGEQLPPLSTLNGVECVEDSTTSHILVPGNFWEVAVWVVNNVCGVDCIEADFSGANLDNWAILLMQLMDCLDPVAR